LLFAGNEQDAITLNMQPIDERVVPPAAELTVDVVQ